MMYNNNDIVDAPIHEPETDYHFSFGSYLSIQFKLFAYAILIAGFGMCLNYKIFGLVLVFLALVVILGKKVLTISFTLTKYRYAFRILKWDFGNWESFPNFESISVFSAKKGQVMSTGSQTGTATFSEIEVNLIYNRSRRLTVFTTDNPEKALRIAKQFSTQLDLPVYNAITRDAYWLE